MGKRAVYNNQHLAIYITGEDFETMLGGRYFHIPVFIGKSDFVVGNVMIVPSTSANFNLTQALKAERQAVQEIQDQFAKDHPDYENSTQVQRRQQHARRKVR